ncbi:MAG: cobalt transporter, inner rane subunit CbiQ, partial [Firmicutes bacterium]|nr:cobalt transporter, inner rane subunit CbiQ [Bacillota bacterium]
MLLPEWMIEENIESGDAAGKKNKSNFLRKSLRNMRTVIFDDRQTEHYARCNGALQKVSPPMKLISMLVLILAVSLSRQVLFLLFVWLVTLLLMQTSRLPVWTMQKRIWGFIPLLTLLFSLPVMLNIFMDGTPLFYIYQSSKS